MHNLYPFVTSFLLIFLSELGDKTQLLVLSFSTKLKTLTILLGVAIGSFLSHGLAILFGSFLGNTDSILLHRILEFFTYFSFILLGFISLFSKKEQSPKKEKTHLSKFAKLGLNYVLVIALSIAIGELGDKTFLASIGLGIGYPSFKFALILGAIAGMVLSDLIAICLGKFLTTKIPQAAVERLSSILFLLFGILGLVKFLFNIGIG